MRLLFLLVFAIVGTSGALSQSFDVSQPPVLQDPYVSLSFASQLNEKNPLAVLSGAFPQASDLDSAIALVPSGWSFSIGFQPTTFNSSTARLSDLFCWATLPNSNQLPDWLEFENDTLTFSGVAPKYAETPANSFYNATFVITVFSSLISGQTEGAASTSFILEIAGEVWTVVETLPPIVTVAQSDVASRLVPALMDAIRVNQQPLENFKDISMDVDTSETPWLRWDSATYFLSGTTPDTLINGGNFSLPCILRHEHNTLHTSMALLISPAPFISFSLPNLTVYPGIKFSVSYADFIRPGADRTAFAVTLSRPLDWLRSNPESLEFYGLPPSNATTGETLINAINGNGTDISSHATFLLAVDIHRPVNASPQASSTSWSPLVHRGLIATIVLLPLFLATIVSLIIRRYTGSFRRRLFVGHAQGRSHRKSIEVESFDFEKGGSVRAMIPAQIDAPQSARVTSATWKDGMPGTSVDTSSQVRRVRLVTVPAPGSPLELFPIYGQTTPTSSKYRPAKAPSIVVGMADLPSMSFTTYFRSPQTLGLLQSEGEPDHLSNLDVRQASPHSSARSVNSAYDSLPSWDSESTWARDRRRRPPSPAWRRGDLQPRVDGATFFDYLEEKGEFSGSP